MPTVASFFDQFKQGELVAARLGDHNKERSLYYIKTKYPDAPPTFGPPSLRLIKTMKQYGITPFKKVIRNYNIPKWDWINANKSEGEAKLDLHYTEERVRNEQFQKSIQIGKQMPVFLDAGKFTLDGLGPDPELPSISERVVEHSVMKARRLYMLAAFVLLRKASKIRVVESGVAQHNIASLLVDEHGKVLAWGFNTGDFRHAEVNTVMNYFDRTPSAKVLPPRSVLFSTLKPCAMCSSLIKSYWGQGELMVYYGMNDTGLNGGSPLLGDHSTQFAHQDQVQLKADSHDEFEFHYVSEGTKPVNVGVVRRDDGSVAKDKLGVPRTKVSLTEELNRLESQRRTSAANLVDQKNTEVERLFDATYTKFFGKVGKERPEDTPVRRVLVHLRDWLRRAS